MKVHQLIAIIAGSTNYSPMERVFDNLPRWAAMSGIDLTRRDVSFSGEPGQEIDIPMPAVQKILALDFAERQADKLRAFGEKIPTNFNVWHHAPALLQALLPATASSED